MLYTDGSKLRNQVGFTFIFFENEEPTEEELFRMSDHATIFNAELHAILVAVKFISQRHLYHVLIRSDSMSALTAIQYHKNYDVIKQLYQFELQDVSFQWVKAPQGVYLL